MILRAQLFYDAFGEGLSSRSAAALGSSGAADPIPPVTPSDSEEEEVTLYASSSGSDGGAEPPAEGAWARTVVYEAGAASEAAGELPVGPAFDDPTSGSDDRAVDALPLPAPGTHASGEEQPHDI